MPILFTRYAVAYSSSNEGTAALDKLKPSGKFKTQPGGVALQTASYNVRMLRAGYLYIRIESAIRRPEWLGYVVHPHGYLTRFDVQHPEDAVSLAACSPQEWGANRSLVWIREPKEVTKLNFMFHPDAIDPDHLMKVIGADPGKYMQSFDVAAWAKGSKSAPDTAVPAADVSNWPVADFMALKDEAVRNALEPQLYGLMGSSAIERGWGDYEETREVETDVYLPTGGYGFMSAGGSLAKRRSEKTVEIKLDYENAHGRRLQNIARYLADNSGAVAACEDAIGIAQELGHLQAEVQNYYTHWQLSPADGFKEGSGVTNEWAYQSALGARGLMEMIRKGAVQRIETSQKNWSENHRPAPFHGDAATRERELARRKEAIARNQQAERELARQTGDAEYARLFDEAAATQIIEAQDKQYKKLEARLAQLGADHCAWLKASGTITTVNCYSTQDAKIGKPGGGGALSLQLAQCLSGTESNRTGREYLSQLDPWGNSLLARTLSFNSETLKKVIKDMDATIPSVMAAPANAAAPMPAPDNDPEWYDRLPALLKPAAAQLGLGDKALAFMETTGRTFADSVRLRRMTWPLHIASLLSVKMMQSIKGLPATQAEAKLLRYAALTGIATLGTNAADYAQTLSQAHRDRLRNAERKLVGAAYKTSAAHSIKGVPGARSAALAGVFDVANVVAGGFKLTANRDGRSALEMAASLLQGIGSIMDYRATAYAETIQKGVRGTDIFTAKAMPEVMDKLNSIQLKSMRVTAFKFLLPAAMASVFWDVTDAFTSDDRGQKWLARAQMAGVVGTVFTIAGIAMTAFGLGSAAIAAALGLIGALLAVISLIAVWLLSEPDWVNWLGDNPLNKERKRKGQAPVHKNLRETLQKLANAQAAA